MWGPFPERFLIVQQQMALAHRHRSRHLSHLTPFIASSLICSHTIFPTTRQAGDAPTALRSIPLRQESVNGVLSSEYMLDMLHRPLDTNENRSKEPLKYTYAGCASLSKVY